MSEDLLQDLETSPPVTGSLEAEGRAGSVPVAAVARLRRWGQAGEQVWGHEGEPGRDGVSVGLGLEEVETAEAARIKYRGR